MIYASFSATTLNRCACENKKERLTFIGALKDITMIQVTRLNGTVYWLNPHQIETIECNPDVTKKLLSGNSLVVKESVDEIIDRIVAYRKRIGVFRNEL